MRTKDAKEIKVDLEELRLSVERNREERLKFVKEYAEWLKKTPNKVWSRQQNAILGKK